LFAYTKIKKRILTRIKKNCV